MGHWCQNLPPPFGSLAVILEMEREFSDAVGMVRDRSRSAACGLRASPDARSDN